VCVGMCNYVADDADNHKLRACVCVCVCECVFMYVCVR
jgi:hypothetical protein